LKEFEWEMEEDKEITLEIDGREVKAKGGLTILEAARSEGIDIPTLCYHAALSPFGACRLCSVKITTGHGRERIVTSCTYPVEEGLKVETKAPEVIVGRKMILELLLARCPDVKEIKELASGYGVEAPRSRLKLKEEECILCGLCTRICEERMGVSAINFVGRGVDRKVETPFQRTLDINLDVCMTCGACAFVCPTGAIKLEDITGKKPIPIPSEFEMGLTSRAPIYVPFPQAIPNVPVIGKEKCVHFLTGECRICEEFCEADAIDFEQEEEVIELNVGAIVVATGYDLFDPSLEPNYGYEYDGVITGLEFERLCNASGPTKGKIEIKGKEPKEVVFISCVGSREKEVEGGKGNEYCSRVCCMYIAKQAHLVKEHIPDATVTVFYTDVRAFGKGFEEFYWSVKEEGVNYIRRELTDETKVEKDVNGRLKVKTVSEGRPVEKEADLVVLATGIIPRNDTLDLARKLKITQSSDKFFLEAHPKLRPIDTLTDGIFIAGCCQSPKDIPDSVAQASAAASRVCSILSWDFIEVEPIIAEVNEELCIGCGSCEEVCPFGAIELKEEELQFEEIVLRTRKSYVNPALCKGCGACIPECPVGAMTQKQFTSMQIEAMLQ
jgi:heterodisulfide reductase subunit A